MYTIHTMKKYLPLILFITVLAILAFSYGVWKRRQIILQQDRTLHSIEAQVESGKITQEEADKLIAESNVNNENSQEGESEEKNNEESGVNDEDLVLKEVKRSSSTLEGAEAIKITNAFLMAYNQRSFSGMATLFTPSTAGRPEFEGVLNEAVAENSVRPISFQFENIEVRGDSSVMVTIKEVRANDEGDKLSNRRLIELIPLNGQHKISAYFKPDSTDTISGFAN